MKRLLIVLLLLSALPTYAQLSTVTPDHALNVQDMGLRGFTYAGGAATSTDALTVYDVAKRIPAHPGGSRGVYVYSDKQLVYGGSQVTYHATSSSTGNSVPLTIATTTATLFRIAPGTTRMDMWFVVDGGAASATVKFLWVK